MPGLPWYKRASGASEAARVVDLCSELGIPTADAYVGRAEDWIARECPSGTFTLRHPAAALERAVRWGGEPGVLWAAMLSVGLVLEERGQFIWNGWEKFNGAHVRKVEKDNARPNADYRHPPSAQVLSLPAPQRAPPAQQDLITSGRVVAPTEAAARAVRSADPPLIEQMQAVYYDLMGKPYHPTRQDEEALRGLLQHGPTEIISRWEHGIIAAKADNRQRAVFTIAGLARPEKWNANATAPPSPHRGSPHRAAEGPPLPASSTCVVCGAEGECSSIGDAPLGNACGHLNEAQAALTAGILKYSDASAWALEKRKHLEAKS